MSGGRALMRRRSAALLLAIVPLLALVLDRLVKLWVTANMQLYETQPLIPGFIELFYVHNEGAAFGLFENAYWLFVTLALLGTVAAIYCVATNRILHPLGNWAVALVVGGAWGNALDRLTTGYVVDMFHFTFVEFAIFNVADIFLTCGGILLCVYLLFKHEQQRKKLELNTPPEVAPENSKENADADNHSDV